jgi:hypothetical protein
MRKLILALTVCFSLGCVTVAHADFWGRLAHAADVNWITLQKDTTKICKRIEKAVPHKSGGGKEENGKKDKDSVKKETSQIDKNGVEIKGDGISGKIDKDGIGIKITWHGNL